MIITKIEEGNGKKYRVFADESFLFSLYAKELRQFDIVENSELTSDTIVYILDSIVYKRAKERALFLLERKPYTVRMMETQLLKNEYSLEVVHKVTLFLQKYHYLDDSEYIKMYINSYASKKSKKQLLRELCFKGVERELVEEYFKNNQYSEDSCFVKQFDKYIKGKDLLDYPTRQKVFSYFYRKGFSTALIESYIHNALVESAL